VTRSSAAAPRVAIEFIDKQKQQSGQIMRELVPGTREFAEKYRAKHGDYPSYHGASAYAALFVVKDALDRARSWSQDGIRDALKATNIKTAFGPVKFSDKDGYQNQNFMDTLAIQVIKGQFVTIWPKQHASAPYVYPVPTWRERR
jgi:branched-chain amino acid transport system substrate-binding protein